MYSGDQTDIRNKLLIGTGIGERLRKTSQDEGRYKHDKITRDEPTRVAINYFKRICSGQVWQDIEHE